MIRSPGTPPIRILAVGYGADATLAPASVRRRSHFQAGGKTGGRVQWYPFFEGDYLRDTYHLTWDQDLAYRRLLDLCYRNGGSVPMNRTVLYQKIRVDPSNREQVAAVEFVLKSYFKGKGKSYQNQRVLKELSKADQLHAARVKGGKERAKRAAQLQLSSSPAEVSTATATATGSIQSEHVVAQTDRLGVPLSLWAQYRNLRERLHRPILAGAEDHIFAELIQFQAAGEDPTEILTRAVRTSSWKLSPNGEHKGEKYGSKAQERDRRNEATFERALHKARAKVRDKTRGPLPD